MQNIPQHISEAVAALQPPTDHKFGKAVLPFACVASFENGSWGKPELKKDTDMLVSAASPAIQYAQSIFEGMKAFKVAQEIPQIFRARDHAARFNISAKRMCIPDVPEELFLESINLITILYENHIPSQADSALYVRPSAYGTDVSLIIEPSQSYRFSVHAAPTLPFATSMKSVFIERNDSRSSVGGTGNVKASGNYAGGYLSLRRAQEFGCATTLWLDPLERRYIDELSLMNFFAVIDGVLTTPILADSFLPGFTRRSLLTIADHFEIPFSERKVDINELIDGIADGSVSEAFSCGTAAVVSPIRSFVEQSGEEYVVSENMGAITGKLRKTLMDIQQGKAPDQFNWMTDVRM